MPVILIALDGNMNLPQLKSKQHLICFLCTGIIIIAIVCYVCVSRNQVKNDKFIYEISRTEASLEEILRYARRCTTSISSNDHNNDFSGLIDAFLSLESSINEVALLQNRAGRISIPLLYFIDDLNGTYSTLPEHSKLYCLNCIITASQNLLSVIEQTDNLSIDDFYMSVSEFSSILTSSLNSNVSAQ